jgi:hypothetical protein
MSNGHNIPPFFRRRIDHHKFEKMMRQGIPYVYYDSSNVEEFKFKLVTATLENYLHYKYNIELTDVPSEDVVSFVEYMVDTYDPLLVQYYRNMRREGRGTVNEGTMDNTIQRMINSSVKELLDACDDFDDETFPDYLSLEDCDFIDLIHKITVKKITPIKKLSNLPMFDVEIDIDYISVLSSMDFEDQLTVITDHIKKKYKIFLVFTVMEQNNLHDRQMEESLKPLIKNVLREEMTDLQMYMWKIKRELQDNYSKVIRNFEDPWLKNTEIESVYYSKFDKVFEVVIKSNTNWELTWWVQFDENMKMNSVIRHETKDWEYNIKDVEEIGGFENDYKDFWSVIKYIYPYAQKYIVKNKKESLNENIEEPLKKFLNKFWDSKKDQGEIPMIKYSFLKKLGLLNKKDEIGNYYIEYMGGKYEVLRELDNYLDGNEFTTLDIENEGVGVGGYDFTFKIVDFRIENVYDYQSEAFVQTKIVKGTVDTFDGEHYDLVDDDSIPENLWWEIENELRELIIDFVYKIIYSFGLNVDDLDLGWY